MFDKTKNIIYCDLDGVLADFDAAKKFLSPSAQTDDDQMWKEIAQVPRFYRLLQPMRYARALWSAIEKTGAEAKILTAIPRRATMPTAEEDKRWWCNVSMGPMIFGNKEVEVLIGPHSRDKHKHCKPGDILIDDRRDNCEQWSDAGGVAILHKGNTVNTIERLRLATNQQPLSSAWQAL